jgi:hypothetical protein
MTFQRVYSLYKPFLDAAEQGTWGLSFSGVEAMTVLKTALTQPFECGEQRVKRLGKTGEVRHG